MRDKIKNSRVFRAAKMMRFVTDEKNRMAGLNVGKNMARYAIARGIEDIDHKWPVKHVFSFAKPKADFAFRNPEIRRDFRFPLQRKKNAWDNNADTQCFARQNALQTGRRFECEKRFPGAGSDARDAAATVFKPEAQTLLLPIIKRFCAHMGYDIILSTNMQNNAKNKDSKEGELHGWIMRHC